MHSRLQHLPRFAGAVGLSLALSLGGLSAFADDDDPTAYLYEGTCADLATATMVDEIDDLDTDDEVDVWALIGMDQDMPDGLLVTEDDVDDLDSVQTLVDGEYAVVVHQTDDISSAVLVCGDIGGEVKDDSILVELDEVESSTWEGRALVRFDHDDDNHDDDDHNDDDHELEFAVGIYPAGTVDPLPEPTPAG